MKIYIGADHRGFNLKEAVKKWLIKLGYDVVDCGNFIYDKNDDFPDFSLEVARRVATEAQSLGIVICGSGGGVTIAANKVKGIRCAQAINVPDVTHNRSHDDINVLAIGSDFIDISLAKAVILAFIKTPFKGSDRFRRRLGKIAGVEN